MTIQLQEFGTGVGTFKGGLYGDAGSGKTWTATLLALYIKRFFKLVPAPRAPGEVLLLGARHAWVVPEAWRSSAFPYRYAYRAGDSAVAGPLLICGTFFPGLFGIESARRKLARQVT